MRWTPQQPIELRAGGRLVRRQFEHDLVRLDLDGLVRPHDTDEHIAAQAHRLDLRPRMSNQGFGSVCRKSGHGTHGYLDGRLSTALPRLYHESFRPDLRARGN